MIGGKKIEKVSKTKFKKHDEYGGEQYTNKKKHHDKSFYRLMKEDDDYEYFRTNTKSDKRN